MNKNVDLKKLTQEYLKSYYSINSYIGCTINCAYCFLAPIKIVPMRPIKVIDEEELIDNMINDKYFEKDKTVISLNNRTDPFISDEVKSSTFKLLDIMERKEIKNIVTITSKGLLTKDDAVRLDKYKNIKIVIIATYNGIPSKIQPIAQINQENTMKNVSKCKKVYLLHQFRPIIPDINDDEQTIRKVVEFAKKYCDATIFQGVRVNDYIKNRLKKRNYNYKGIVGDSHKQKSKTTDDIFETLKKEDKNYQIFDHTSCALGYMFKMPDYNLHYLKRECSELCKNYNLCHNDNHKVPEELDIVLKKIGVNSDWKIENKILNIDGPLNDEQKSYIKHILNLNVKSKIRENTYSEKIMEEKNEYKNIF